MLNVNINFDEAQKNGYNIKEDIAHDRVVILSPFSREIAIITGKGEGKVQLETERGDIIHASRVDTNFLSMKAHSEKMLRIDMDVPDQKYKKCICTIIESAEKVEVSIHRTS